MSVPLEPPAPATGQSPAAAPGSPDSPSRGRRAGRMRQAIPHGLLPIAGRLALAYLALTAVWAGLGLLLTGALAGTWVGPLDRDVAGWLVGRRTALLDGWSQVGSMLAETMVKVIVTAVIAVVMLLVWRSWREPFLVSFALILEAAVFITVTWLVARPAARCARARRGVRRHQLPVRACGGRRGVRRHRHRDLRTHPQPLAPHHHRPPGGRRSRSSSASCRMYRGVHYLTDVIGGIALGCRLCPRRLPHRPTGRAPAPPGGPAANGPDPQPDDR